MKTGNIALLVLAGLAAAGGVYFLASGTKVPAFVPTPVTPPTTSGGFGVDFAKAWQQTTAGAPLPALPGASSSPDFGVNYGDSMGGTYTDRYASYGTPAAGLPYEGGGSGFGVSGGKYY